MAIVERKFLMEVGVVVYLLYAGSCYCPALYYFQAQLLDSGLLARALDRLSGRLHDLDRLIPGAGIIK